MHVSERIEQPEFDPFLMKKITNSYEKSSQHDLMFGDQSSVDIESHHVQTELDRCESTDQTSNKFIEKLNMKSKLARSVIRPVEVNKFE